MFDPADVSVLLTGPTGTSAFGINELTLHTGLSLSTRGKAGVTADNLNTLRCKLGMLELLIIDEVSMVGNDMLLTIHRRLKDIKGEPDSTPFGGVSILVVGDLFQL